MQTTAVPNTLYPNLDHHVQEIIEQGYTVVPNVLSSDEVREINEIIDAIFDKEKPSPTSATGITRPSAWPICCLRSIRCFARFRSTRESYLSCRPCWGIAAF